MTSNMIEEAEKIEKIRSFLGVEIPNSDILKALSISKNDTNAAIRLILDNPDFFSPSVTVKRTSTGARVSAKVKEEESEVSAENGSLDGSKAKENKSVPYFANKVVVKAEPVELVCDSFDGELGLEKEVLVKEEAMDVDECKPMVSRKESELFDGSEVKPDLDLDKKEMVLEGSRVTVQCELKEDKVELDRKESDIIDRIKVEACMSIEKDMVKEEAKETNRCEPKESDSCDVLKAESKYIEKKGLVKEEPFDLDQYQPKRAKNEPDDVTGLKSNYISSYRPNLNTSPASVKEEKKPVVNDLDDGEFPDEPDWLLVGRSTVVGLSTCRRKKLEFNEIVYFAFPSTASTKMTKIVRFSTKRSGEIGRLPIEWTNCLIPLVNSKRVKLRGRFVAAPSSLCLMQEIHLYVSFYIHHSIFTDGDKSSWSLTTPSNLDTTVHPLPTLFKLLKIVPFQKAAFTPEELDTRKRSLGLQVCCASSRGEGHILCSLKKGKLNSTYPQPKNDEQVIPVSTLNKLVGTADVYNLEEMDPPSTLMCVLHPYQKQALYWMSESEKGVDVEEAAKMLHPCWAAYRITDKRASAVYVNIFSGEATTCFPSATKMARGGILADAMGLGKTVMTIALILARSGKGVPDDEVKKECKNEDVEERKQNETQVQTKSTPTAKGGTLIVCPMALLGQWKDELDTHSRPGSLQVFMQYGVDRSVDPKSLSENDVVLTTYGVLQAAYKSDSENSIFHRVEWFRVVLDEAHTIKSSKTQVAQAAFALSSHCRWCLTGTPLQNNLEDLYSLLCFLHVAPWCNWAWWQKLIQKPYDNGDERGMRLIKSILRPLMLRRTKDTQDKEGRPILVLPPTDIQVIECKQSEAERDFYDALFKRSKVQFDQFVAQGKVLHNYAHILELLLRLRQCCNHPILVMSRADTQKYTDLDKLTRQFLQTSSNTSGQSVPSRAYVEEVVEGIRKGQNTECPICLESADDPVFTPCAHRMCRECLFSSWRSPSNGVCPICRQHIYKNELITCPSENQFRVDIENNWKESSKVSKLLTCLEKICHSGSGEKSIIFSQWTSFFDLLEIALKKKGIEFLRFDGRLSQKNREYVLKEFSDSKEKMVLLMSLKAGGVGLNLTAASNVFLMDPWWNPAVEEQAIMRIHRIGQKRVVHVRRFIVKDTVEERMQEVQARKERMIAGALTDGEVRSVRIEELKMLFR